MHAQHAIRPTQVSCKGVIWAVTPLADISSVDIIPPRVLIFVNLCDDIYRLQQIYFFVCFQQRLLKYRLYKQPRLSSVVSCQIAKCNNLLILHLLLIYHFYQKKEFLSNALKVIVVEDSAFILIKILMQVIY